MFSGLVRRGVCGSSYTIKNRDQLACSAHREKGACDNNRTIRVLEGIEMPARQGEQVFSTRVAIVIRPRGSCISGA
jgi:hypothetical protein